MTRFDAHQCPITGFFPPDRHMTPTCTFVSVHSKLKESGYDPKELSLPLSLTTHVYLQPSRDKDWSKPPTTNPMKSPSCPAIVGMRPPASFLCLLWRTRRASMLSTLQGRSPRSLALVGPPGSPNCWGSLPRNPRCGGPPIEPNLAPRNHAQTLKKAAMHQ